MNVSGAPPHLPAHLLHPDPDHRNPRNLVVGEIVLPALVVLHDDVEAVLLLPRVVHEDRGAGRNHAPVPHPPRAGLLTPDDPVTQIDLDAARRRFPDQPYFLSFWCRVDVKHPVLVPEAHRHDIRHYIRPFPARKPDPAYQGLGNDLLHHRPVSDLTVSPSHPGPIHYGTDEYIPQVHIDRYTTARNPPDTAIIRCMPAGNF